MVMEQLAHTLEGVGMSNKDLVLHREIYVLIADCYSDHSDTDAEGGQTLLWPFTYGDATFQRF